MKRKYVSLAIALSVFFIACNGGGKETAESIAKKWCDLNGKVAKASTPEAKEAAEKKRKEYENTIEEKYKTDTVMRDQVMKEVEKCEGASEGR